MMTDEKANTEDQSNMEDQVTENSVDASAEEVIASTEVTEEAAVESNKTAAEPSSEVEASEESVTEEVIAPEAEAAVAEEASAEAEPTEEVAESKEPAPVVEEVVVVKKEKKVDDGKRWYSLRVISGKERKIKERIELELQRSGWTDFITQILVPTEKVYKIRQGKKVISERNILPGYILVEALAKNFTGEMVQTITGMPNVIHFLGRNNPIPMQQSEANRMLGKVDESQDVGESLLEPFIVGETVKIIDGPFNEFVGDIQEINDEKKK